MMASDWKNVSSELQKKFGCTIYTYTGKQVAKDSEIWKPMKLQQSVDKNTRFVELRFESLEKRNDYIEDLWKKRKRTNDVRTKYLELSCLENIYYFDPKVKSRSGEGVQDRYVYKKCKTVTSQEMDSLYSDYNVGDLIGWAHTKHTLCVYNPLGEDYGWFVGCRSKTGKVQFIYTCDLTTSIDDELIQVMNNEQLVKTYSSITCTQPETGWDDNKIKEEIEKLCGQVKIQDWLPFKTLCSVYDSKMVVQIDVDNCQGAVKVSELMGGTTSYDDMEYIICENDNRPAEVVLSSSWSPEDGLSEPDWAKKGRTNGWTAYVIGSEKNTWNIIDGREEMHEEGGLRVHVYHAYRRNEQESARGDIDYYDGYNESREEIAEAKRLAQQLRTLYAQYKGDFREQFEKEINSGEYKHLMLNEEFLSIHDDGPEVAHINENLLLLNLNRNSQNKNVYSQATYDGVIRFKDYLNEIDSDLFEVLEIDQPCGNSNIHPRCSSSSNEGPCGCWTYSCYIFKEMTFRADVEDVSLDWDGSGDPFTLFSEVDTSNALISGDSCTISRTQSSRLSATVNNGYQARIRISAFDINQNSIADHPQISPNTTPFRTGDGENASLLDITVKGSDQLSIKCTGNNEWVLSLTRLSPHGSSISIPMGSVMDYPNLWTVSFLKIEILDARPPFADWKLNGHGSPQDWGQVCGIAGLSRIANDFSQALKKSAAWGAQFNIPIQLELCFGIEAFYVLNIEIGGFVGVEIAGSYVNSDNSGWLNKFKTGFYAAGKVDLGAVSVDGRIEWTNEWLWNDGASLCDAVKDWLNDYIRKVDKDWCLDLPRGFRGRESKVTTTHGTKVLKVKSRYTSTGDTYSDPNPETKFKYVDDNMLPYPNFLELSTKPGNNGYTKFAFGYIGDGDWSSFDETELLPAAPTLPSYATDSTDFRFKAIAAIGEAIGNTSLQYSNLQVLDLFGKFESLSRLVRIIGHVPDKLSFEPWAKLGKCGKYDPKGNSKTGFSAEYDAYISMQIITENHAGDKQLVSGDNSQLFDTSINHLQNRKFGFGWDLGGNVALGFKICFYPSPWVSIYLGAKFSVGFEYSQKVEIMNDSKTLMDITSSELQDRLENSQNGGG